MHGSWHASKRHTSKAKALPLSCAAGPNVKFTAGVRKPTPDPAAPARRKLAQVAPAPAQAKAAPAPAGPLDTLPGGLVVTGADTPGTEEDAAWQATDLPTLFSRWQGVLLVSDTRWTQPADNLTDCAAQCDADEECEVWAWCDTSAGAAG